MNALRDGLWRHRQAEFEPLAGGRAKFDDEKIISRPVGRQAGIDFFQRPFVGGYGLVEGEGFDFNSVCMGRGQPCRKKQCGCSEKITTGEWRFHVDYLWNDCLPEFWATQRKFITDLPSAWNLDGGGNRLTLAT
jgi:hypothetical protein